MPPMCSRRAAAFDHRLVRVDFVAAIDVHVNAADAVQIAHAVAERLKAARAFVRGGDDVGELHFCRAERFDEAIDRRAAADPQCDTVFDIMQRRFGRQHFQGILIHFFTSFLRKFTHAALYRENFYRSGL